MGLAQGAATFKIIRMYDTDKEGNQLETSSGLPKVTVLLAVKDKNGFEGKIYDTLHDKAPWRIEHLCKAIERIDLIDNIDGLQVEEFTGGEGKCELKDNPPYGIKVERYVFSKKKKPKKAEPEFNAEEFDDQEIPF